MSASSCNPECQHSAGQTRDRAPYRCSRGQAATGSCSVFTAALDTRVNIQGSTRLLCAPQPLGDCTQSSISKCSSSSGGTYTSSDPFHRTHPASTQSLATRDKHNTFPYGLPSDAPKTILNLGLYSRLLFPLQLCRIKRCLLLCLSRFYTTSGKCAKTADQGFHVVVRA